jgi:hypothetical protein
VFWGILGGMPSDWITRDPPALLSSQQVENLQWKLSTRLTITVAKLAGPDRKTWWPNIRQISGDLDCELSNLTRLFTLGFTPQSKWDGKGPD